MRFRYYDPPSVSALGVLPVCSPLAGPSSRRHSGQVPLVTVRRRGFQNVLHVALEARFRFGQVVVGVARVSDQEMLCVTPPHRSAAPCPSPSPLMESTLYAASTAEAARCPARRQARASRSSTNARATPTGRRAWPTDCLPHQGTSLIASLFRALIPTCVPDPNCGGCHVSAHHGAAPFPTGAWAIPTAAGAMIRVWAASRASAWARAA